MKLFIWTLALIGIALPCLLSIVYLVGHIIVRLQLGEGGFVFSPGLSTRDGKPLLALASSPVPAALTLLGTAVFLIGLTFLIPSQPTVVRTNGFAVLGTQIDSFLNARTTATSLMISTPDQQHVLFLTHEDERVTINFVLTAKPPDGSEEAIRRYFASRAIAPTSDYRMANGGTENAAQVLGYPLPRDAAVLAQVCREIFTEAYRSGEREGLSFSITRP